MKKVWDAIKDETRRKILGLLRKQEMTAGEIVEHFETSQPTISHHLSVLRDAGLIVATKSAQSVIYSIHKPTFQDFVLKLDELFGLGFAKKV